MGDSLRYKDWYEKAAHDLRGAQILKGWLPKTTDELFDGHSLVFLCRKAIAVGAPLKDKLRDCAYVNQFYIETRYPSDAYIPVSEKEAQDCIDAEKELLELLA